MPGVTPFHLATHGERTLVSLHGVRLTGVLLILTLHGADAHGVPRHGADPATIAHPRRGIAIADFECPRPPDERQAPEPDE